MSEAQQATKYWFEVADEWVKTHPDQAYHALILLKKLDSWYLYPHDEVTLDGEAAFEALQELSRLEGDVVRQRRNAKVTQSLLNRLVGREDWEIEFFAEGMGLKKSPVFPSPFNLNDETADDFLLEEANLINEEEFKDLCLRAEIIE